MTPIERLRQNPAYASMSDDELVTELHKRPEYASLDIDDFRSRLGIETVSMGEAAFQGATQGATFGFADEIGALGRAAIDKYLNRIIQPEFADERPFGEIYTDIRDRTRGTLSRARREHPYATYGAEIGTGILQGGAGAGAAAGRTSLRAALPRLAGVGAGYGGVAGLGYSEADSAGGMAADTAFGAATGAALGAAIPAAVSGASRVGRGLMSMFRTKRGDRAAQNVVRNQITARLREMGMGVDEAETYLRDHDLWLADLMPDDVRAIATTPGDAGRSLINALEGRQLQQGSRITRGVQQALGGDDIRLDFHRAMADQADSLAASGRELYGVAYEGKPTMTGFMRSVIDSPEGKRAVRYANRLMEADRLLGELDGPVTATRQLDYFQRGFNSMARATSRGDAATGAKFFQIAKKFTQDMERSNPAYARARAVWRRGSADQDAMELGTTFFNKDADEVLEIVKDMSQSELLHARMGILRGVQRLFERTPQSTDVARRLRLTDRYRKPLEILFPDRDGRRLFEQLLTDEELRNATLQATGARGSATALNVASQGRDAGAVLGTVVGAKVGAPWAGRLLGARAGGVAGRRAAEATARRHSVMAPMLIGNDLSALRSVRPALPAPGMVTNTAALTGARIVPGLLE